MLFIDLNFEVLKGKVAIKKDYNKMAVIYNTSFTYFNTAFTGQRGKRNAPKNTMRVAQIATVQNANKKFGMNVT